MVEAVDSRQAILDAAKRLFMEQGFRGISMRQIAEAVGVTKAALYYHFQDKEELFVAIVERYLLDMTSLIDASVAADTTVRGQISIIVHRILSQPVEQRSILRLASQELSNVSEATRRRFLAIYHERFIQRITTLLETGMANGELRPLNPALATWTLLGMMYPYFHPSPPSGMLPTAAEIDQLLAIFFDGIAARRTH
jgi:AcrR family transcriptional regulator